MFEIVIIRAACAVTMAGTFAASATIVNEKSLVPLGLLVAAVTGAVVLTWKVAAILFKERGQFTDYIISAGPVSYFLNLTCMALGFFAARLFRLDDRQSTTVSIEIGVQNSATGIFIAATLLNNSEIAIVPAVYGLVMFLNAGLLLLLMRQSYNKEALKGNR